MEMPILYLIVAIIVGILFPVAAILSGKGAHQMLTDNPEKRPYVYRFTILQLCALAILVIIPFLIDTRGVAQIGLGFVYDIKLVLALFGSAIIGLWVLNQVNFSEKRATKIIQQYDRVRFILPVNKTEYRYMILTSFAAGICEEIIYRGFLLWFLMLNLPIIPAILLANLPFALAHLTSTGVRNTVQAFVLALIFTGLFFLTNSLWLPILLHILVDMYSGTIWFKACQINAEGQKMENDEEE